MLEMMILGMAMQGAAAAPADYDMPQNWLCYPGRRDVCSEQNYDATQLPASGEPTRLAYQAADAPAADCFYVYPTVSRDSGGNSDLVINEEERSVVLAQFARFGSECRQFAPLYRQITLTALRARIAGETVEIDRDMAYGDVLAAFRHYMQTENNGRPFVLYGHSQGSGMLKRLVAEEIDGKPVQDQMLSAMLIGTNVNVSAGEGAGGDFQNVATCKSADQTGCLVSFVTFRDDDLPDENTRFGRAEGDAMEVACTNPADLSGQQGDVPLRAAFLTSQDPGLQTETTYVATTDLIRGRCVNDGEASFLSIGTDSTAADRMALYEGLLTSTRNMPGWGLHMVDTNVAQDDLIGLVASQAQAYSAR